MSRSWWKVASAGGFGEADVASLPVMTETGLTGDFDDIVTGWRLCRELCERHLGGLAG